MIPVPWHLKEKHCLEPCYYLPTSLLSQHPGPPEQLPLLFLWYHLPTFPTLAPMLYPPPPVRRLGKLQTKCTCVSMSDFSQGHQKREVGGRDNTGCTWLLPSPEVILPWQRCVHPFSGRCWRITLCLLSADLSTKDTIIRLKPSWSNCVWKFLLLGQWIESYQVSRLRERTLAARHVC